MRKKEIGKKKKERKMIDFPHDKNGHNSISGRLHHCVDYSRIQRLTFSLAIDNGKDTPAALRRTPHFLPSNKHSDVEPVGSAFNGSVDHDPEV